MFAHVFTEFRMSHVLLFFDVNALTTSIVNNICFDNNKYITVDVNAQQYM